MGDLGQKGE